MLISELSTLRLEPGSRLAELDWGPLVTGESARRIACDAAITQVIVDSNGEPQALLYLPPHPAPSGERPLSNRRGHPAQRTLI
jgi:hypothetical protein